MKYSASLQCALSARRGARKTKARLPGREFPLTFGKWEQVCSNRELSRWAQNGGLEVYWLKGWHFPCFSCCSAVTPWVRDNCCSTDCKKIKFNKLVWTREGNKSYFSGLKEKHPGAHSVKPGYLSKLVSRALSALANFSNVPEWFSAWAPRKVSRTKGLGVAWAFLQMLSCNIILKDQNAKLDTLA